MALSQLRFLTAIPSESQLSLKTNVDELNGLVAELSTSAAHRERVFLEERLKQVKQELDRAAKEMSQFSSKTAAIDIKEQGRAMVEAAAVVQGQMIAAQSELKGLEAIYTEQCAGTSNTGAHHGIATSNGQIGRQFCSLARARCLVR